MAGTPLGNLLREARTARDLLAKSVAGDLGVSAATYSQWERGQRVPRPEQLEKVASIFKIPREELRRRSTRSLGWSGHRPTVPPGQAVRPGRVAGLGAGLRARDGRRDDR